MPVKQLPGGWKALVWGGIVLVGLSSCRPSRPAGPPDVAKLLQRRQLQLGKSSEQRVVRVLGPPTAQTKGLLHGLFRDGSGRTTHWVTLYYPKLGIECVLMQTPAGPRLDEITLKAPYPKPVLDSVYLNHQLIGVLARGLRQPVWNSTDDWDQKPYEVRGGVSVAGMRLEAQVQLDSVTWNRCRSQPSLLDSLIGAMPVNQIVFTDDD